MVDQSHKPCVDWLPQTALLQNTYFTGSSGICLEWISKQRILSPQTIALKEKDKNEGNE